VELTTYQLSTSHSQIKGGDASQEMFELSRNSSEGSEGIDPEGSSWEFYRSSRHFGWQ